MTDFQARSSSHPEGASADAQGAGELLAAGAQVILGRPLVPRETEAFTRYLDLLTRWQRVHRLVGSVEPEWVVENLFLDSMLFLKVLPDGLGSIADVGSGAGFPGLPLKIVRPDLRVALVESRQRRQSFLSAVVRELGLDRVLVVGERLEHGRDIPGVPFDAVVMRCAGKPGSLLADAARMVAAGGVVVFSGPPAPRPSGGSGDWVEVPGVRRGQMRRFLIHRP